MNPKDLAQRYPELYHMAEEGSWPSIEKYGLLSTSALLDVFEVSGAERHAIESEWRPKSMPVRHAGHGTALIRDQVPMPAGALGKLLVDMTTREWYELINGKTFFWLDRQRLVWLLNARQYRSRVHCVLTVDTRELLERHAALVTLSGQNSGSLYSGKLRGRDTFRPIRDFSMRWVVELAVEYGVPDIADLTIRVEEWKRDKMLRLIWQQ